MYIIEEEDLKQRSIWLEKDRQAGSHRRQNSYLWHLYDCCKIAFTLLADIRPFVKFVRPWTPINKAFKPSYGILRFYQNARRSLTVRKLIKSSLKLADNLNQ